MSDGPYKDTGRQQTYWSTDGTNYRRRRHAAYTWPIILALLIIALLVFSLFIFTSKENKNTLNSLNGLPLIEATHPISKKAPDTPGGKQVPHQDKFIFNAIDGAKPLSSLGAEYQAEAIRKEPEAPIDTDSLSFVEKFEDISMKALEGGENLEENFYETSMELLEDRKDVVENATLLEETPSDNLPLLTQTEEIAIVPKVIEKPLTIKKHAENDDLQSSPQIEEETVLIPEVIENSETIKEDTIIDDFPISPQIEKISLSPIIEENIFLPPVIEENIIVTDTLNILPYTVQTAAMYTTESAKKEWDIQLADSPILIGKTPYAICKKYVSGYGMLQKLYIGQYPSEKAAQTFCDKLKKKHVDCFVIDAPITLDSCSKKF